MQFGLHIDTDNAAFEDDDPGELCRILRKIADDIEGGRNISHFQTILDVNGNDVGRYALTGRRIPELFGNSSKSPREQPARREGGSMYRLAL